MSDFLSFRAKEVLSKWVRSYAGRSGVSVSDVLREALLEYKARRDSTEESELGPGLEALRSEIGHTFRVVKSDSGILFEKVRPGVVELS